MFALLCEKCSKSIHFTILPVAFLNGCRSVPEKRRKIACPTQKIRIDSFRWVLKRRSFRIDSFQWVLKFCSKRRISVGRDSPVEVELDAFPARKLEIWGSRGIGLYISFPNCGTNLRTETCLYTKSARSGGAWGGRKGGAERRHRRGVQRRRPSCDLKWITHEHV